MTTVDLTDNELALIFASLKQTAQVLWEGHAVATREGIALEEAVGMARTAADMDFLSQRLVPGLDYIRPN